MRGNDWKKFTCACKQCNGRTSIKYARAHNGQCKACSEPEARARVASQEEQRARYLDCGPQAWDDRDNPDF